MKCIRILALTITTLLGSSLAQAGLIIGDPIPESGDSDGPIDDFVWTFLGVDPGMGLASLILNYERLDTDGMSEFLNVFVDGALIGDTSGASQSCVDGSDALGTFRADCNGSQSFVFDTAALNDGVLNVIVSSNGGVDALYDVQTGPGFAAIEIRYDSTSVVPSPATAALLTVGLLGLTRRRKG